MKVPSSSDWSLLVAGGGDFKGALGLLLHLVQPDGGFEHEHDFEALAANVGDDAGNQRRLRDALVNGLAQLLNQFAEFLIQVLNLDFPGARDRASAADSPYLIV